MKKIKLLSLDGKQSFRLLAFLFSVFFIYQANAWDRYYPTYHHGYQMQPQYYQQSQSSYRHSYYQRTQVYHQPRRVCATPPPVRYTTEKVLKFHRPSYVAKKAYRSKKKSSYKKKKKTCSKSNKKRSYKSKKKSLGKKKSSGKKKKCKIKKCVKVCLCK